MFKHAEVRNLDRATREERVCASTLVNPKDHNILEKAVSRFRIPHTPDVASQ